MPIFERGSVVRVPFPYKNRETRQRRPALVVSAGGIGENEALLWVVMVTSAENRSWPGDVPLGDGYGAAGLPAPSVVRTCKVATIEARHAEALGKVQPALLARVERLMRAHLGLL